MLGIVGSTLRRQLRCHATGKIFYRRADGAERDLPGFDPLGGAAANQHYIAAVAQMRRTEPDHIRVSPQLIERILEAVQIHL